MCELFGVSAKDPVYINEYLKEFYKHSEFHPHGWGLGIVKENQVNIEKEPIQALKSHYIKERLKDDIYTKIALGHIRYATIGNVEYKNCHPYTKVDRFKNRWTLVHNGTVFYYPKLDYYIHQQKGDTDSERILLYMIDRINEFDHNPTHQERFDLFNQIFTDMTKDNNKINIIFTDGELVYVHTNMKDTLYMLDKEGCIIFATSPLSKEHWVNVPFTRLLAYKDSKLMFEGENHHHEYIDKSEDNKHLYQIFSDL